MEIDIAGFSEEELVSHAEPPDPDLVAILKAQEQTRWRYRER
jgi:hypothetical protein